MKKVAIKDLKGWAENPRDLTETAFRQLISQLRLGEISNMVVMKGIDEIPDQTILNGNRRRTAYEKVGKKEATVAEVEFKPTGDGRYHLYVDGEQAVRLDEGHKGEPTVFDSVEQGMLQIALATNTNVGVWNQDLLEMVSTFEIPEDMFQVHMTPGTRVEDLIMAIGPLPGPAFGGDYPEDRSVDRDEMASKLETYEHGTIKQIVVYFTNESYLEILPRIQEVTKRLGAKNTTEVFLAALEALEEKLDESD